MRDTKKMKQSNWFTIARTNEKISVMLELQQSTESWNEIKYLWDIVRHTVAPGPAFPTKAYSKDDMRIWNDVRLLYCGCFYRQIAMLFGHLSPRSQPPTTMAPEGKSNLGMLTQDAIKLLGISMENTSKRKIQVALVVLSWRLVVCLILRACCGMEAQNNIQHDRYLPNFDQTIQNRCHVWTIGHWYTTNKWLWSRILYWLFGSCWIVQDTFALIICQV